MRAACPSIILAAEEEIKGLSPEPQLHGLEGCGVYEGGVSGGPLHALIQEVRTM